MRTTRPRDNFGLLSFGLRSRAVVCLTLLLASIGCGISDPGDGGDLPSGELEVRNLEVVAVTDTSATLKWNTTRQASCTINYGRSQAAQNFNESSRLGVTHQVTLDALDEQTEYWYQVQAASPLGPSVTSQARSFTTARSIDRDDTTPPVISGIAVIGITPNSATITFRTDDRASGKAFYGLIPSYGHVVSEAADAFTRTHALVLNDLQEAEEYHFRVQATNRAGLSATGSDLTFRTAEFPTIEIAPDTIDVAGEEEFTFRVRARGVSNLAGIAMVIAYDRQMVEIISVRPGDFWSDHRGFLFLEQAADPIPGLAQHAASWEITFQNGIAVGTNANGTGDIAIVRARAIGARTRSSISLLSQTEAAESANPDVYTRLLDHNLTQMQFNLRGAWVVRQGL